MAKHGRYQNVTHPDRFLSRLVGWAGVVVLVVVTGLLAFGWVGVLVAPKGHVDLTNSNMIVVGLVAAFALGAWSAKRR